MPKKKHEMVFNEIDKTVRASLGLAFSDDQEFAIRKAIISAFIAYENFEAPPHWRTQLGPDEGQSDEMRIR